MTTPIVPFSEPNKRRKKGETLFRVQAALSQGIEKISETVGGESSVFPLGRCQNEVNPCVFL